MTKEYIKNLSIIIPHYNTPDLLEKLINSIPNIDDIQIIVVDDNSNVQLEALAALQKKYSNHVEFYKNDTGIKGAGACRNIGLRHADGKWLLFADADDFFVAGMYETVSPYFETDYDEIFFTPTSIYLDTGEQSNRHFMLERCINNYLANPTEENLLNLKITTCSPWSKMISHDLVYKYDIWFDEVLYSNDIMFTAKSGYYSKKIMASKDVIYCITRSPGSLTTDISWEAFEIRLYERVKVCDFLLERYTKKELKRMQYTCSVKLVEAIKRHYGIKKYLFIIRLFHQHGIPMFTWNQISLKSIKTFIKSMRLGEMDFRYYVNNK